MAKQGVFDDGPTFDEMQERVTASFDTYYSPVLWQTFRSWVKASQPKEDWVRVKLLKQRNLADLVSCTPAVLSNCLSELEQTLLETGIMAMKDGKAVLLEAEAHRLATTDEKGHLWHDQLFCLVYLLR